MNRTIKDATVKRFYYDSHDQLRQHLIDFVAAYNFARRLKTLRGLTPYEAICKAWTDEPFRFMHDPPNRGTKHLVAKYGIALAKIASMIAEVDSVVQDSSDALAIGLMVSP